jgi:hypothetical protein
MTAFGKRESYSILFCQVFCLNKDTITMILAKKLALGKSAIPLCDVGVADERRPLHYEVHDATCAPLLWAFVSTNFIWLAYNNLLWLYQAVVVCGR